MPRPVIKAGKFIAALAVVVAASAAASAAARAVLGGGPSSTPATLPPADPAPITPAASAHTAGDARLLPLHEFEETLRRQTDFRALPTGDAVTGPDPYVVRALPAAAAVPGAPGAQRLVSILRGAALVVLLDADLHVTSRAATPRAPTGLAVADNGDIFVSSELTPVIARYRVTPAGLQPTGTLTLPAGAGVRALRDLVAGSGAGILYAADEIGGRLLTLRLSPKDPAPTLGLTATPAAIAVGHGPFRLARVANLLLVDCLLDHTVVAFRIGKDGAPAQELARVRHDGPLWSFDAVAPDDDHLLLLVGGVEDHPLDRTGGSFGYIDSFLTVYRLDTRAPAPPVRLSLTNLSALGVVTPKVVSARLDPDGSLHAAVTGYATSPLLLLTFPKDFHAQPGVVTQDLVPGTTSMVARADGTLV
ncbi:MAG: hypothetical protein QOI66_1423, partial [Myxococcales bacterium]|nr:hypothetical protein [Myxococcales bacterium]